MGASSSDIFPAGERRPDRSLCLKTTNALPAEFLWHQEIVLKQILFYINNLGPNEPMGEDLGVGVRIVAENKCALDYRSADKFTQHLTRIYICRRPWAKLPPARCGGGEG
jgi:hypothetical protein